MRVRWMGGLVGIGLAVGLTGRLVAGLENARDSAPGLPPNYAKNYLVAKSTMSPDKKFAVIYPTLDFSESKEAKDMLVALKPFKVLATLATDFPYHQSKSNSGLSAQWSKDGSVALITIESKWGPGDLFVVELSGGEVKRTTNVLEKLTQLLSPKFRGATPKKEAYNDFVQFVYTPVGETNKACTLAGNKTVKIELIATNDPKGMSENPWSVRVKAEWDIASTTFSSQKITEERR